LRHQRRCDGKPRPLGTGGRSRSQQRGCRCFSGWRFKPRSATDAPVMGPD
jgi:hypothetical protein